MQRYLRYVAFLLGYKRQHAKRLRVILTQRSRTRVPPATITEAAADTAAAADDEVDAAAIGYEQTEPQAISADDNEIMEEENDIRDRREQLLPLLGLAKSEECLQHLASILNGTTPSTRLVDFMEPGISLTHCNPLIADDDLMSELMETLTDRLDTIQTPQHSSNGNAFVDIAMFVWALEAIQYTLRHYFNMSESKAETEIAKMPKILPQEHTEVWNDIMNMHKWPRSFDSSNMIHFSVL